MPASAALYLHENDSPSSLGISRSGRRRRVADLREVVVRVPGAERVYDAARRVIEAGLAGDGSLFTPERAVWTRASADDLEERFVQSPQIGSATFVEKLGRQLAGASQESIQLMAELLYLHLLPPVDIGGKAKRRLLAAVLDGAQGVTVPPELDDALDEGFARTGTAYLTQRDRQVAYLVRFVQAWKALPAERQREALEEPWAFRAVADGIVVGSAYSQRNALLHLAFPDTFESIVSRRHKQQILSALGDELPNLSGDEDRDLLALRRELERRADAPISFYRSELEAQWRSPELRGWLVRGANVHGRNLVPAWLTEGFCSIAYPGVPGLEPGLTRPEFDARLAEGLPDLSARQRAIHVGVLDRFFNQIQPGHLVATVDGPDVYVGTVQGPVQSVPTPGELSGHRRSVRWANAGQPFTRDRLSDVTRDRLSGQMTVSSLGPEVTEFAELGGFDEDLETPHRSGAVATVTLPEPTADLADALFLDQGWLDDTVDLLREKHQIVLYGPPGTGKTYLAQELARFLAEQTGGEHRLVQFHPSYSYEDFFEGFRPQPGVTAGTVAFSLEPGPLKLLAQQAAENMAGAHILVIDEINRANLAKVFGELYFLLEYRDRTVQLQYSPAEDFRLPPNLYVIGTMNTADRSIAVVDAAMRRRFAWQGLFPGEPPVRQMLRRWLAANRLPEEPADLLDALNAQIGDRDAAVGPSYLMSERIRDPRGLERIWRHQILPLMEERHAGEQFDVAAVYGLSALRAGMTGDGRGTSG